LKEAKVLKQFVENEGSSLMFGIEEGTALNYFAQRGFYNIILVSAPSLKQAYFRGESTKRPVTPMFNFDEPVKSPIMDGFVKAPRSRLANPEEYRYRGCRRQRT
jgi:hypothetical protein